MERAETYAQQLRLSAIYNLEFLRGDALARLNRVGDAEAAFRREISAFPRHLQAYAYLALIPLIEADRTGADRLMDEMARANPSLRAYLLAASTYQSLGETSEAAAWRRRAENAGKATAVQ